MSKKVEIDVKKQVTLSLKKSFNFCKKGIVYRLFRSMLTLAVVIVAVAFLMSLLSESVIVSSVRKGVENEVQEMREADTMLNHIFYPHSSMALSKKLAAVDGKPTGVEEFAAVTGIGKKKAEELLKKCILENEVLYFLNNIDLGKRMILVKKNKGRAMLKYLIDKNNWQAFTKSLDDMKSVKFPCELQEFRDFLNNYNNYLNDMQKARQGWLKSAKGLEGFQNKMTGGKDITDWIAEASDSDSEKWRKAVVASGFILDPESMGRIKKRMTVSSYENNIIKMLQNDEKRKEWKKVFKSLPGIEKQIQFLEEPEVEAILDNKYNLEQRALVTKDFNNSKRLRGLEALLPPRKSSDKKMMLGFLTGSQLFLVIISFLVCMVGITNAMLMSITERFREIATMKCLGATDGFILTQFLIEAAIQGLFGGALGMILGLIVTILKATMIYGEIVYTYLPIQMLVLCSIYTLILGVLISMLASIYPSIAAAKMAPMDAMRVE